MEDNAARSAAAAGRALQGKQQQQQQQQQPQGEGGPVDMDIDNSLGKSPGHRQQQNGEILSSSHALAELRVVLAWCRQRIAWEQLLLQLKVRAST